MRGGGPKADSVVQPLGFRQAKHMEKSPLVIVIIFNILYVLCMITM